ncbi:hypothetical protein [Streptomyces rimosus]|uniref:hypothetical protein n=1 Tax=Streptomyces rimosus TaxID=1927 RepID=UPI0004CB5D25|nr:hypothetical protein [Streptomyces rimosus]
MLILCHIGTLIHFPIHVAMWIAVFALVIALSLVGEFVFAVLFFLEKPALELLDRTLDRIPFRPKWWATWNEVRHEGDPGFARARIEKVLNGQKPEHGSAGLRAYRYRGIGPLGALEVAAPLGWQLSDDKPARPRTELKLRRAPAQKAVPAAAPVA